MKIRTVMAALALLFLSAGCTKKVYLQHPRAGGGTPPGSYVVEEETVVEQQEVIR